MPVGIGASGSVGIAFETLAAPDTYVAPTKFIPIENETLKFDQNIIDRRPIQAVADAIDSKRGDGAVSGDIMFAAYHDVLPYFLYAGRTTVAKTGAGPWTYDCDGAHGATATYTLSITVVRNGVVFGYTGCVVSSFSFSMVDSVLMCTVSIVGQNEAVQSAPTESYYSTGNEYSAGDYSVEFDDTAVGGVDNMEITIEDNAEAQFRLIGDQGSDLVVFGERTVSVSLDKDFENRTEYDLFKAATAQKVELIADDGTHSIAFEIAVAIIGTWEANLSGQGDLVRATINYDGKWGAARNSSYNITVVTDEDITVPVA